LLHLRLRSAVLVPLSLLAFVLAPAVARAAAPQPYGTNDAGGFRNVLPPGENGLDTLTDVFAFRATGALPAHFADQQPLYENLVYGSPGLTDATVGDYFKDATFGVPEGQVASTIEPRPGATITRDSAYGIPHIYGDTRADTMFGAGYAGAQDRLFLMDVLRHTGRAELASFLGGSNAEADASQWGFAPYTEADLEKQLVQAPQLRGADGAQAVADVTAYVEGINAYVEAAKVTPTMKPAEYSLLGQPMEAWKPTDIVAIASLVGGIFGRGGGRELDSALTLQAFESKMGRKKGRKAWLGFRAKNDPEAPTTISKKFPYETRSAFAKAGLAMPDKGSVRLTKTAKVSSAPPRPSGFAAAIMRSMRQVAHASNWEVVSAKESASGHPIGVLGPQVGYYVPQILMEEDLHGPGIDARGASFAGVNLFVQLGHGRDYAWSATSAGADNVDTFAEVLCKDNFHYRYRGKCKAMEKLEKSESWVPNTIDSTEQGSQTLTAYRTVHGILYARGKVGGKKVAYVRQRSTYFHEADSVIGFAKLNEPGVVTGPAGFKQAVADIGFTFNWAYLDADDIAYAMSGDLPQRAKGTSPDFPVLGTGKYDWKGFKPATQTATFLPFKKHPQAVNPPYMVSWNNKQAPEFAASDDNYAYGPLFRSQMIADRVKSGTKGSRKMTISQLVQAMEEPATEDLRADKVLPLLLKAIGKPKSAAAKNALATLSAWQKAGAHRRDLDRDGVDEETPAIQLMDAWWPRLVTAQFKPALGNKAFERLQGMIRIGDHTGGSPDAPDFYDGWWGYVSRDLRTLFGPKPKSKFSRVYCGGGSKKKCRSILQRTLAEATRVSAAELYGGGNGKCATNPQPSCFDQNRPTVTGGIDLPPFPFQNRPTFQQVVTLTQKLPR
jgi:acyl-homoserine lactone acylase PvdQ